MTDLADRRYASALLALKEVFGFPSLRPFQDGVLRDLFAGHDVFIAANTGAGKSLTFALPSLVLPGVTLVISPLIALMRDQVTKLKSLGVRAAQLSDGADEAESVRVLKRPNDFDIIYTSPERAASKDFRAAMRRAEIGMIAADEAHYYVKAQDFRPAAASLAQIIDEHPDAIRLACTATADDQTEMEICKLFRLRSPRRHVSSPWRDNIRWTIRREGSLGELFERVAQYQASPGAQVVYVTSRKAAEDLAQQMSAEGLSVAPYHAGLPTNIRTLTQERFTRHEVKCIVATNAFGMGIDIVDIRFVGVWHLPESLFSLLQAVGRASRDGAPAEGWVNVSKKAAQTQQFFITTGNPPYYVYTKLWRYLKGCTELPVRMSESYLAHICGVKTEALFGQVRAAVSLMEYHRSIEVTTAGKSYTFKIRNPTIARKMAAQTKSKIKDDTLYYTVNSDGDDLSGLFVSTTACWPGPKESEVLLIRPISKELTVTEEMVDQKRSRALSHIEELKEFCWSQNKKAFVESVFVQHKENTP